MQNETNPYMPQTELDEIIAAHNSWLETGKGIRGDISRRVIHGLVFNNLDTYRLRAVGAEIRESEITNCNIEWPCLFGTSWVDSTFMHCSFGQSKHAVKRHYNKPYHNCKCYSKRDKEIIVTALAKKGRTTLATRKQWPL